MDANTSVERTEVDYNLLDYSVRNNVNFDNSSESNGSNNLEHTSSEDFIDQFGGVLYDVQHSDSKTIVVFRNRRVFDIFLNKMKSDFSLHEDNLAFTTHIHSLKTNICIDKHAATATATGVGHKMWRLHSLTNSAKKILCKFLIEENVGQDNILHSVTHQGVNIQTVKMVEPLVTSTPVITRRDHTVSADIITQLTSTIQKLQEQVITLQKEVAKIVSFKTHANSGQHSTEIGEKLTSKAPTNQKSSEPHRQQSNVQKARENNHISNKHVNQTGVTSNHGDVCQRVYNIETIQGNRPTVTANKQNKPEPICQSVKKNQIQSKTLLVGSSILHGINPQGLFKGVHKHSISGAGIDSLSEDLELYDLTIFNTIIVYIGGNDASRGMDAKCFESKYERLLVEIKQLNPECNIIVCTLCPRGDVDVHTFNHSIKALADKGLAQCIDLYSEFLDNVGVPAQRFYGMRDNIHLSRSGTKKLLGTLNKIAQVCSNYDKCVFGGPQSNGKRYEFNGTQSNSKQHGAYQQVGRPYNHQWNGDRMDATTMKRNPQQETYRTRRFSGRCYDCDMIGHRAIDCWNH